MLNGEQTQGAPSNFSKRQGHSLFPNPVNKLLEVLVITIKQEKEIKEIQMGKEVTLSVSEYVILFIGVLKSSPKGLSQLRNDFIKLQETIISKHMYSLCRVNSWSFTPSLQSF